jgi:S-adenosylmethionine hydrolase
VVRIDKFGHLITDVLVTQIPGFGPDSEITIKLTNGNTVPCCWRLADAPDGELAAVRSSAGYRDRLHLMLSVRGLQHYPAAHRIGHVLGRQVIDMSSIG